MEGWVKLHRQVLENGWLTNPELWTFWSYCMLKASYQEHTHLVGDKQVKLLPGQFVFGRNKAAEDLKTTVSKIRTCIKNLKKMKNVTIESTNKYSILTVVNWRIYQGHENENDQQLDQQITSTSPAHDHKQECKNERMPDENYEGTEMQASQFQRPLSFEEYQIHHGTNDIDKQAIKVISYFLGKYAMSMKREHPNLKPVQWQKITNTILMSWDDAGTLDLSHDELALMIDRYFKTKFQEGCDYSILHFSSYGVKKNRFYEEVY
jgi:hypothetical protein